MEFLGLLFLQTVVRLFAVAMLLTCGNNNNTSQKTQKGGMLFISTLFIFLNQVRSHYFVPCVVHRCASVDVRCTRVCTVHHEQLSLQDLACLCCHMERGGAFLLEGQADTQTESGQEAQKLREHLNSMAYSQMGVSQRVDLFPDRVEEVGLSAERQEPKTGL